VKLGIGVSAPRAGQHPAAAIASNRRFGDDQPAELERAVEGGHPPDPDQPSRSMLDQLGEHDGGALGADPGGLDRQLAPVAGGPGVAPEAVLVIRHPRALEQVLGEGEREPGIARQEDIGGDRRGRAEVAAQAA
jgi:hypothetical protein